MTLKHIITAMSVPLVSAIVLTPLVYAGGTSAIPNSGFEEGIVGEVPTHWTAEYIVGGQAPWSGVAEHDVEKSDAAYYEGSHSLYGRAYFKKTAYVRANYWATTWARSEYVNNPGATQVIVHMRGISRTHPPGWGWNLYIFLELDDGTYTKSYLLYQHGQTIKVHYYNFTAQGSDGYMWYGYVRDIPSYLDETHLRVSLRWQAGGWYWYPGPVHKISSYVDDVFLIGVDFDPDTLNLKGRGKWVTVYIEHPHAADIDATTVRLNDTVPAVTDPASYLTDRDGDGTLERMVKFDRGAVQGILEPGDEVVVTVTGELYDGRPFEGSDTITVISEGNK